MTADIQRTLYATAKLKMAAWLKNTHGKEASKMKFIEIENRLINLDNVTAICKSRVTSICKSDEELIRIHFNGRHYIDIEKESEEELNKVWERLKSLCMGATD